MSRQYHSGYVNMNRIMLLFKHKEHNLLVQMNYIFEKDDNKP